MKNLSTKTTRWIALGIAAATFCAFLPVLQNQFVAWDDQENFTSNFLFRGLTLPHLRWMFTGSAHAGMYIPLTWVSLALDYHLWGMNPRGFHLTNVLLHVLSSVLFFVVALSLLEKAWPADASRRAPRIRFSAALAAMLFAVHPLRVESVAWVTERRDVLSGFFYLLTLLAYVRYASSSDIARRRAWYGIACGSYLCALLSKPMVVTLPFVLTLLDVYPLKRIRLSGVWWEKIPFWSLAVPAAGLAMRLQSEAGFAASIHRIGLLGRMGLALYAIAFYVCKTLWPSGLSPLYPLGAGIQWTEPVFWASAAVAALLTGFAWKWRTRWPGVAAAWAYYLLVLLPVSGLFLAGKQKVADRYSYLPCMGLALVIAATIAADWEGLSPGRAHEFPGRVRSAAAVLIIAGLMGLTWAQCGVWTNSLTLWSRVLSQYPDSVLAHNNLGTYLQGEGHLDEAIAHYRRILEIDPSFAQAHSNLGNALQRQGKTDEAIVQFEESIKLNPADAGAYSSLGIIYFMRGNADQAADYFRQSIALNSADEAAHTNLGVVLANKGRLEESIAQFREALRLDPTDESARRDLDAVQSQLTRTR